MVIDLKEYRQAKERHATDWRELRVQDRREFHAQFTFFLKIAADKDEQVARQLWDGPIYPSLVHEDPAGRRFFLRRAGSDPFHFMAATDLVVRGQKILFPWVVRDYYGDLFAAGEFSGLRRSLLTMGDLYARAQPVDDALRENLELFRSLFESARLQRPRERPV